MKDITKEYCTDDLEYDKFKHHGSVKIFVSNKNIAVYKAKGLFNAEFADALAKTEPVALLAH